MKFNSQKPFIMKKLLTFLILIVIFCMPVLSQRDTLNSVIISEFKGGQWADHYTEITNMGDDTVNLSDFYFGRYMYHNSTWDWTGIPTVFDADNCGSRLPDMELPPGKSLVVKGVYDAPTADGQTQNLPGFLSQEYFYPVHWNETSTGGGEHLFWDRPDLEMWGKDSIDVNGTMLTGRSAALWYCFPEGDSVMIDMCNLIQEGDDAITAIGAGPDVAGIPMAHLTHILVRKYIIKEGNTNFELGRGIDLEDSEWIPVPFWTGREIYSTVGSHGPYSIDISSESVTINDTDTTMIVPWAVMKGDSIVKEFDIGPGMSWVYIEDTTSFADSAFSKVQAGDILTIMACGDSLEVMNYKIQVSDPEADMARVFPKRRLRYPNPVTEPNTVPRWGGEPYYVTDGDPVIDTIGSVAFATRVDSLFKLLQKAPNASWEIDWVDDMERIDLIYGDKLIVTAEDGTTQKEYFIDVQEYVENDNAYLGAITWPDRPSYYMEDWKGDTIPLFDRTSRLYQILLPFGTRVVPAFKALAEDRNAVVEEERATNLRGSQSDRTTTFTVIAEDDSTVMKYTVIFNVEKDLSKVQAYVSEPFFSEIVNGYQVEGYYYEIVNVGDVPLDLSNYLLAHDGSSPAEAITDIYKGTTLANFLDRYDEGYVPGFKFSDDSLTWQITPGELYPDLNVDPVIDPGDVFVLGSPHAARWSPFAVSQSDVITGVRFNTWNLPIELLGKSSMNRFWNSMYLFRIDNDSILEGTKEVYEDILDYTLIDQVGNPAVTDHMEVYIGGRLKVKHSEVIRRLPSVFDGDIELDTIAEQIEWTSDNKWDEGFGVENLVENVGFHSFDPVTIHMSTVASVTYLVSDGYSGLQTIQSGFSSTTVDGFYGNISKADTGQNLTVISGVDGLAKDLVDNIAGDDTLVVVSADSINTTKYLIIDEPLDDNAVLIVKDAYQGSYTITIDDMTGTITGSGIVWGKPVKEILAALIVPDLAIMNVIDQDEDNVPMKVLNYDTNLVDVRMHDSIYLEVVPQNGIDIIKYKLTPASASNDAFVISSLFLVDQDNMTISLIPGGLTSATLLDGIFPVTGATMTILDKYGFERSTGNISLDDKLRVVSEDGSKTVYYYLNLLDEDMPDNNEAPTLSVDITSANVLLTETLTLKATADDDGMPLPTALTVTWEVISGEGVTIVSPDALETDVTFAQAGAVVLQVTVDDGEISQTEIVNVGVSTPGNVAPTVTVATASFTAEEAETISVSATAGDDGNPVGSTLTYTWSVKTGEAENVTIASPDQLDSDVTISVAGVYTLQITVTDGELIATDIVVVVVTEAVGVAPVLEPALKLYPNPVSNTLNLEMINLGEATYTVKIFNITGQAVYNAELSLSREQIDMSMYDAGMYFVTVNAGNEVFTQRIQVVK